MCGIFGKLYFSSHREEKQQLLDCLHTLDHRGPDDAGYFEDDYIFLGSTRLSIIDLSRDGNMPMPNGNGSMQIVFNGEVYNYLELRRSLSKKYRFRSNTDTEVVLHLYEEYGPACLNRLRGMFAFAVWDRHKKELFIARDQLGKKPLKFYLDDDCFIFASELKAILKDPHIPRELDQVAIDNFLTFQYVPSPRTGFKNINKLEPGHYLTVSQNGKWKKHHYAHLDYYPKLRLSEEEAELAVLDELKQSVKLRLRSDVPLGAHLSGGIDSSLVVALAARETGKPLKTFSVGFTDPEFDELPFARRVAEQYGTDHHEIRVGPEIIEELPRIVAAYEEPYADPSMLPTWRLCRETKKEVTVALNGDGGDENFAGYLRYQAYLAARFLKYVPFRKAGEQTLSLLHRLAPHQSLRQSITLMHYVNTYDDRAELYARLVGSLTTPEKKLLYTASFGHASSANDSYAWIRRKIENSNLSPLESLLSADIHTYLSDDLLVKIDIAGMAHSLEVRSPFLDQRFMDFAARLPDRFKLNGLTGKYLLKRIAARYLPHSCVHRKKHGFEIPLRSWIHTDWKPFMASITGGKLVSLRIMDARRLSAAVNANRLTPSQLWTLYALEIWLNTWF